MTPSNNRKHRAQQKTRPQGSNPGTPTKRTVHDNFMVLEFYFRLKIPTKGGFKSEDRGGFSKLPKMSAKKTILGFRKWKFWLFFAFTGLIYFQVLQIGSRSIINQLIKPVNAKKSVFSFFKSQDSFFGTHFGQLGKSTSTLWLKATFSSAWEKPFEFRPH